MNLIPQKYGVAVQWETKKWGDVKKGFTHFAEDDVALAKITPCFQNGKSCVMRGLKNKFGAGTTELHIFRPIDNLTYPEYVLIYFKSVSFIKNAIPIMTGTAGQKRVPNSYVAQNPFPLPPLAEQKRIVEKCDRLLSTCDEIEKRQQQRQQSILRMNESAIAQLLSSQNPDDFRQHWQRICNNFDLLYSIPETIPKLRQAILQLAVQGKLVRQNPNDEPALSLLKRIRREREELARERKQTKLLSFSQVVFDEIPYQLPKQWIWIPLGELLISSPRNGYSPKPVDYPTKVKSLTLSATTSGKFKNEYFKYIDEEISEDSHLWLENGDILIQRANTIEYVGIAAIYKGYSHEYIYPDLMMKIRCSNFLEIDYIHLAINNENSRNFLRARATGTSSNMPKINQLTVNSLPIPLPPLAEQKRIVEKCDRLMSLCDTLEAKLKQERDSSEKLMEVAAKQVLSRST
ncbi:restriction endonuclease subunit S [Calothrix sp. FACHB-1219]|uniref:restriction endonuclease subunit S n=1 Tax=unclassified Calothrix TaxID=2619626 RepID=UPI00168A2F56|nr:MULTISPECIES: restriction endonuclease subunit S [unclassified Calothrix]MBD2208246.1 restriction endonuclease subunit S [Calothrix sp. FACHB-168]MBD2221490.1 restriction endonuclease subunit S [Calothrix sp. FACHB-1219]